MACALLSRHILCSLVCLSLPNAGEPTRTSLTSITFRLIPSPPKPPPPPPPPSCFFNLFPKLQQSATFCFKLQEESVRISLRIFCCNTFIEHSSKFDPLIISLSLSLSVCLSVCLSVSLSLSLSLYLCLSVSGPVPPPPSLSLFSVSLFFSASLFLAL